MGAADDLGILVLQPGDSVVACSAAALAERRAGNLIVNGGVALAMCGVNVCHWLCQCLARSTNL